MSVRSKYLNFFKKNGHKVYDSAPLVPDDASLLFTNAGMVQFKDIFTAKIPIPEIPRATSSQLCIRAGGKHNDLENVGYTARHHTLFEMLGNFSFGDYFKENAIEFAWEFVTKELGIDKNLIYISVHESDDEALNIWSSYISKDRIAKMGDKDNFWQMGDSGPCGPCSEIYVDQGSKYFNSKEDYFGGEGDRFLEIWNLVFMQYEQMDGKRDLLPKPSIDTGMGLERVMALLEGKINNFDTTIFAPLMKTIEGISGKEYYHDDILINKKDVMEDSIIAEIKSIQASFRVIADHARSVAFLLAQGVNFDKEGRGYVLRRILRRAVRHGYLLGLKEAFLHKVINCVCETMSGAYGYLMERKNTIIQQCKNEEERFFETIESGMELFNKELKQLQKNNTSKKAFFSGDIAFRLYDTYGFPLDLTQDMLRDENIEVDLEKFELNMNEQKQRSKASWKGSGDSAKEGDFLELINEFKENEFIGYENMESKSRILALLDSNFKRVKALANNESGFILLDKTPFYPESGGPIGDIGIIKDYQDNILANVVDTKKYFELNLSKINCIKEVKINDNILAIVDSSRLEIAKHHSATHLLHFALRKILGNHIAQAGSLVESNRLRFDFSHPKALSDNEINDLQDLVNSLIWVSNNQECENMTLEKAKQNGAMALFGEKYGSNVRVISFGDSIELCGGIHVKNTAEIGSFYIVKESGVSSGVRRIEAVCGKAAYQYSKKAFQELESIKVLVKNNDILAGINKLKNQIKELKEYKSKNADEAELKAKIIGKTKLIIELIQSDNIKELIDREKNQNDSIAILLISEFNGRISIAAGVKNTNVKASEWVKEVAKVVGGNGGGRDDFATAGGKDKTKIKQALEIAQNFVKDRI